MWLLDQVLNELSEDLDTVIHVGRIDVHGNSWFRPEHDRDIYLPGDLII